MDYLEIAKKHYLNVIEVSIIAYLVREFPNSASIEEMTSDREVYWKVRTEMNNLIKKGLVGKDKNKYKIKKDILV